MIECIFTLDYEIYGNGAGSLHELVYEPGRALQKIFRRHAAPLVNFVEVAELEQIDAAGSDRGIDDVRRQVREFHDDGWETALHLHPQWYNAHYDGSGWTLDLSEYNLCTLPPARIAQIVDRAIAYLAHLVDASSYEPLSFRAGNWLFQPTRDAAAALFRRGLRIDSSVFKGGVQRAHRLDYRPTLRNGDYWRFRDDVNEPDAAGGWIEVPIYSEMVPFWRMRTTKRMAFAQAGGGSARRSRADRIRRMTDFARLVYPLKLDFCRMTLHELTSMVDGIARRDRTAPDVYRPIVAIGHTKDLVDPEAVDSFLGWLRERGIGVTTFRECYSRLSAGAPAAAEDICCATF